MNKQIILLLIVVIGVCLICGCVNQSQTSPQKPVATPTPALKTQFNMNEPATDGNLKITVISSFTYDNPYLKSNTRYFRLKLENLQSDRTIQLLAGDFKLLDGNNNEYSNGKFEDGSTKFDIKPNQREQQDIGFGFPSGTDLSTSNKLKFDFSASGGNSGSPIVYFIL